MESTFYSLASKSNFNKALRHFNSVTDVVDEIQSKRNLADVVNEGLDNDEIIQDQVLPIVGAVIRDKFAYSYSSYCLNNTINDPKRIIEETSKWTALDIVFVYFDPSSKAILINPKNANHWERTREPNQDQLIVIYVKFRKGDNPKLEKEAINTLEEMLAGKDVFINKEFIDATVLPPKPAAPSPAATAASMKTKKAMTPKYAIEVSNELFHNGNVEAWKKIIESYTTKYPGLDVYIFHSDELINDINSLFKWGKVKHGDSIFFQVGGEDIRGVSKLQKYLFEGASQRYEQFLKIGVGKVLNLF